MKTGLKVLLWFMGIGGGIILVLWVAAIFWMRSTVR